jgi:integrase
VFVKDFGNPTCWANGCDAMRKALTRSGIPRDATIHDFRHSDASLGIRQNLDLIAVQHMMGHVSARETDETYANQRPA